MKYHYLFPITLLTVAFLFYSCTDSRLQKYYGSQPHVYVSANAFDSTTAVEVTATWDAAGKVTLSSRLIPLDPTLHGNGFTVDMPPTEHDDSAHTITPTSFDVTTIGIAYDAQGKLTQEIFPAKKVLRFCCQNVCQRECNCADPIHATNYWYCANVGSPYCHACCQLRENSHCGMSQSSDPPYVAIIQSTGIGEVKPGTR